VIEEESLSVVMPVYNALPHLDGAVRSILDQTHRDFAFVIYDDGSTDGSTERLREWESKDPRIRLFEGERNLGPVGSSAFVVEHSAAPLVARMDADDLCSPDRLERQLQVLRDHPKAGLVGTLFDVIDERGRRIRGPDLWRLTRKSPFVPFAAHGSIMFRRSVFDQVGGYRAECEYWEDQDLVVRMAQVTEVMVIPSALYQVRQWTKSTRVVSGTEQVENAVDLMYRAVARLEQGQGYDDLLRTGTQPARVDPRVFISAGSIVLWAGGCPQLFSRLLKRGRLKFDMRTLSALVWTSWAALNPTSLRVFMGLLLRIRNRRSSGMVANETPLRWSPPSRKIED
jgi:glycosyltransferase involved in cell wall biosynthesis